MNAYLLVLRYSDDEREKKVMCETYKEAKEKVKKEWQNLNSFTLYKPHCLVSAILEMTQKENNYQSDKN